MNSDTQASSPSPSWRAALGGAGLFLTWGLYLIAMEIPHGWGIPDWAAPIFLILFLVVIIIPPMAMCTGWIQGFPAWSYPYVGQMLLFSLYMTQMATPGLRFFGLPIFGRELWGWRAFLPLAVVVVVALLATRSLRPLGRFFTNIWEDWTLLSFGLAGTLPLIVSVRFDEMDQLYSLYFMALLAALMTAMALVYLLSRRRWARTAALLGGISLVISIAVAVPAIYWQGSGGVNIPGTILLGLGILAVMVSPGVIGIIRRAKGDGEG